MGKILSISSVSELTGVTVKTLKIWDNEEKLKAKYKTAGGHRRYDLDDIEKFLGINAIEQNTKRNVFIYCRVSTKKQQEMGNLIRQKERLVKYCNERQYNIIQIFEEVASGLNDKRRELTRMLKRLSEIDSIIVEYPDRLARFGLNYLEEFCKSLNVNLEVIEEKARLEPNEEMVNDLISVVTCFSARMYGAIGGKKIKKDIEKSIKELSVERSMKSESNNESNTHK